MERNRRLRESLADSDVFGALTDEELDRLIAYGNPVRHASNHIIFQKGESGDSLMVVLTGRVKISTLSSEGKEAVLNFIEPGHSFGELAMFDGKPRSADATAIEPSRAVRAAPRRRANFLERHPEIAFRIIGILCERVRRTTTSSRRGDAEHDRHGWPVRCSPRQDLRQATIPTGCRSS